jgi:hypothetical protein
MPLRCWWPTCAGILLSASPAAAAAPVTLNGAVGATSAHVLSAVAAAAAAPTALATAGAVLSQDQQQPQPTHGQPETLGGSGNDAEQDRDAQDSNGEMLMGTNREL